MIIFPSLRKQSLMVLIFATCVAMAFGSTPVMSQQTISVDALNLVTDHNSQLLREHFHIGFNLTRLSRLSDLKRDVNDQLYFFPDTVDVYSIEQNPVRYTYFYSENGDRLMTLVKAFENEQWVNSYLQMNTFDEVGNLLVSRIQEWQNENWVNSFRQTQTFTTNHNVLTWLNEDWNGTDWLAVDRGTYTYNEAGEPVAYLKENWTGNDWVGDFYDLYMYDDFGNMLSGIRQLWEINTWVDDERYTYTYDINNNMLSGIYEQWDGENWQFSYKEEYSWNAQNLPTQITASVWAGTDWVWVSRYAYDYNEFGYVVNSTLEIYTEGAWSFNQRAQFTHNFFGGVQSALVEYWIDSAWVNFSLSAFNHDEYGNTLGADLYGWDTDTWMQNHDDSIELSYYYNLMSDYYTGYHIEAAYVSILTGIDRAVDKTRANLTVYPNPASSEINVQLTAPAGSNAELALYNAAGAKLMNVYSGNFADGEHTFRVNISQFNTGLYFVKLTTENDIFISKLLINN